MKKLNEESVWISDKKFYTRMGRAKLRYIIVNTIWWLKVMKRADSCKHRQAVKNIKREKKLFKSHLDSSKLVKRAEKHATSTNLKMAARMESLLMCLLL